MNLPSAIDMSSPLLHGRYELGKAIGAGGFATVFRSIDTKSGNAVAIKRMRKSTNTMEAALREVALSSAVPHPNIARVYKTFHEDGYVYVVMELLKCTLYDQLLSAPLENERLFTLFHQIVSAVLALHRGGISHRDIKLENIMLDFDGNAKLIDFGFATTNLLSCSTCGSPHYMAPELWKNGGEAYDTMKVDVWSLGCVFFCMMFRTMPFRSTPSSDIGTQILTRPIVVPVGTTRKSVDAETRAFLGLLLEKNAMKRISVKSITSHSYWTVRCHLFGLPVSGSNDVIMEDLVPYTGGLSSSTLSSASLDSERLDENEKSRTSAVRRNKSSASGSKKKTLLRALFHRDRTPTSS